MEMGRDTIHIEVQGTFLVEETLTVRPARWEWGRVMSWRKESCHLGRRWVVPKSWSCKKLGLRAWRSDCIKEPYDQIVLKRKVVWTKVGKVSRNQNCQSLKGHQTSLCVVWWLTSPRKVTELWPWLCWEMLVACTGEEALERSAWIGNCILHGFYVEGKGKEGVKNNS